MKKSKKQKASGEITIQFVGKRTRINPETGKSEKVLRAAPARIINGGKVIDLPDDAQQKSGFTHPDASFLLAKYGRDFKRKVSKRKGK